MNYSKATEIQKALDFSCVIDGIEYQIKANEQDKSSALYFSYQIWERTTDGEATIFGNGMITLHDEIADIPSIVETLIRDKILDNLTPRDCVISLDWEEVVTVTTALGNCGQTDLSNKLIAAYGRAEPSARDG